MKTEDINRELKSHILNMTFMKIFDFELKKEVHKIKEANIYELVFISPRDRTIRFSFFHGLRIVEVKISRLESEEGYFWAGSNDFKLSTWMSFNSMKLEQLNLNAYEGDTKERITQVLQFCEDVFQNTNLKDILLGATWRNYADPFWDRYK